MPRPKLITSPQAIYRIERQIVPIAQRAFRSAVNVWRDALAAATTPELAITPKPLAPLVKVTASAVKAGGKVAEIQLNSALETRLSFSLANPAAVAWMAEHGATLIREITDETRAGVRTIVQSTLGQSMSLPELQRRLRGLVGLTERQSQSVANVIERARASGMNDAAAWREGYAHAKAQIAYRAELIARTETITAANKGQQLLWQQAVDSGQLGTDRMEQMWIATKGERTCPICGDLHQTRAPIGGTFKGGYTGPTAHPNCRCAVGLVQRESYRRR